MAGAMLLVSLADVWNDQQNVSMRERGEVFEQLVVLRAILLRERERTLARNIENVLAILEEGHPGSFNEAQEAWVAMMKYARGLPDFGIWREDREEMARLNAEWDYYFQGINRVLGE